LHHGAAAGGRGVVAGRGRAGAGRRRGAEAPPPQRRGLPRGAGGPRRHAAGCALRRPGGRGAGRTGRAGRGALAGAGLRRAGDPPAERPAGDGAAAGLGPRRPRPGGAPPARRRGGGGGAGMTGFVVAGTDTDAGKTAFSLLFLSAFADEFAYWKPVETGDSDTAKVRRLVPGATVFDPLARFAEPVAPALAARREGRPMPGAAEILAAVPASD